MRLIIAEKPSLAREKIAPALGIEKKEKNSILLKNGDRVIWLAGHVMEQAEPDEYIDRAPDPKTGKIPWRMEDLPIIPQKWIVRPKKSAMDLFKNAKFWLDKASEVVNAGDPDREGQLLVDEVLEACGFKGKVWRVWLQDLTPAAIRKAFDNLKPNEEYRGLRDSALARSRADWLIGMNATRAMTLHQGGALLSIGRVQTPTLNLIVERENAIENFVSRDFYEVYADFSAKAGKWRAKWQPPKDILSPDGYLLNKDKAQAVANAVQGKDGRVVKVETQRKKQRPPLPYSLSDLQKRMSGRGLDPSDTLATVQKLYEAGLVTYPRTDCNYLEEGRHGEGATILPKLKSILNLPDGWDTSIVSAAFNDKKVTAHTAIVPTLDVENGAKLSGREKMVFDEVATRYAMQFYPPYVYDETVIETEVEGHVFTAKGAVPVELGWKVLFARGADNDEENKDDADGAQLPRVNENDRAKADKCEVVSKRTQPPKRFNAGEMPTVMKNAARYAQVKDERQKRILKETEGLGTEATRASVLDTLVKREYVELKGKKKEIQPTKRGKELISIVPPSLKDVGTTAMWEMGLKAIEQGKMKLDDFMIMQVQMVNAVLEEIRSTRVIESASNKKESKVIADSCPLCKQGQIVETPKAYSCNRWKEGCKFTLWKNFLGRRLSANEAKALIAGETVLLKGLKSKQGKKFNAKGVLALGDDGSASIKIEFD